MKQYELEIVSRIKDEVDEIFRIKEKLEHFCEVLKSGDRTKILNFKETTSNREDKPIFECVDEISIYFKCSQSPKYPYSLDLLVDSKKYSCRCSLIISKTIEEMYQEIQNRGGIDKICDEVVISIRDANIRFDDLDDDDRYDYDFS